MTTLDPQQRHETSQDDLRPPCDHEVARAVWVEEIASMSILERDEQTARLEISMDHYEERISYWRQAKADLLNAVEFSEESLLGTNDNIAQADLNLASWEALLASATMQHEDLVAFDALYESLSF